MLNRLLLSGLVLISLVGVGASFADDAQKTVSVKGKIFRSDTKEPIANALIVLLDEKKSDKHENSVEAHTDEQGNYVFEKVVPGKYTVSIRAWYTRQEDAPCKLLMAKTAEKDSPVVVARDKNQFVQQVFIKGFSVKSGKELVKDFDFACKSMFGN